MAERWERLAVELESAQLGTKPTSAIVLAFPGKNDARP
jgi:hypothetical protein